MKKPPKAVTPETEIDDREISPSIAVEDDESNSSPIEPSLVAKDISNLKKTILRLADERERLPQPLFWSLFNSRLKSIRKTKELDRLLTDVLD